MSGSKHSTRDVVDMLRHQIKSPRLQRIKQQQCCFRVHSDCDCVGSIAPLRQCCVFGNNNVWHNVCDCSQFDAQCIQLADIYGDDKGHVCQYAQQNVIVSLTPPPPLDEGGGAPKKPSTAKEDRLNPRLKIHSPHSGNPPVSIPSNTIPTSAAQVHRV
jgi:hypothetical protein